MKEPPPDTFERPASVSPAETRARARAAKNGQTSFGF